MFPTVSTVGANACYARSKPDEFAEWLLVPDVRSRFGWSRSSTYRLLAQGQIEGRKVGRRTVVSVASVRAYLDRQPQPVVKVDDASAKLVGTGRARPQTADAP